jgi:hypothetical protein
MSKKRFPKAISAHDKITKNPAKEGISPDGYK